MATQHAQLHENPKGPGDLRPTAKQIIENEGLQGKLSGKVAFITGCSAGVGVETAKALSLTGITLYLTARHLDKARTALGDLVNSDRFLSKNECLNILICNAGVMQPPEGRTKDGFETQFGTNHLSHFLLFNLLRPALLAGATPDFASRIRLPGCDPIKTANLYTANEIERRYGQQNLHAWSVQPGAVLTELMRHLSDDAQGGLRGDPYLATIFKTPDQGAATSVWAATARALEGQGGKYLENCQIAKEWDPESGFFGPGYGHHAYDTAKAGELWEKSLKWVGL
ncbi:uncharacterized protein F5Z01DRAFT_743065 [Emericellopsis atlantica]|uniref:Uncharacterized protein n=1 Tax=Emericellopsis atlantica TaxID=2614577 RepID=A0A9P7ZM14_9HYPO|nr:uncharacterized protein F5Z01DRAFT_743065 [Emericellopsis atlantica]KAG9254599.1 hypothetical protein F5Z01DRAFT_743065 [Emericellopsis atlantica]